MFNFNTTIREVADRCAAAGFVALAPDMYWRTEARLYMAYGAEHREKARKLYAALDRAAAVADIAHCLAYTRARAEGNGKAAVVGFCMGGELALLAGCRIKTDGVIAYYPTCMEPHVSELKKLAAPTVMHFPAADQFIPPATVAAIQAGVAGLAHVATHVYAGCKHAFARPGGADFDANATALAHDRSMELMARLR